MLAISPSRTFQSTASAASNHTKVKLPIEEAVKADFPPGCKVLCFDDEGFRVGIVKNVLISISLPSQKTYGTFYEVEMKSNTSGANILGVFSNTDLRLTPGCPIEVSNEYFGSVFKFNKEGGKVKGTILGSFEIPPSRCNRCAQKDKSPVTRKFCYSVRVKFNGMDEAIEAHGVPPEFINVISAHNTSKRSDDSTINSNSLYGPGSGSILLGGGMYNAPQVVFDDFKENVSNFPRNQMPLRSPSNRSKKPTPEDMPFDARETSFRSSVEGGVFQEQFNESFNIMYQHESNTKAFGQLLSNGNREMYDSETASSFEEMNPKRATESPRGRGRRPRSQSMSRNKSHSRRSQSRTRIYDAKSSRSSRSNRIPQESSKQQQIQLSSSEESMNDYEEDNTNLSFEEEIDRQDTRGIRRKAKRGESLSRKIVDESSDEEQEKGEIQTSEQHTPRARNYQEIADFAQDQPETIEMPNLPEIKSPTPPPPSTPERKTSTPKVNATPSSTKKFGKSWTPSFDASGEEIQDLASQVSAKKTVAVPQTPSSQKKQRPFTPVRQPVSTKSEEQSTMSLESGKEAEGCYLIFDPASGGTLRIMFSKTIVEGAIGFWKAGPGKKIQGFKFTQNQGRSDLVKDIAGKDYKKKYFNGWCQFVKLAKQYKGTLCKWSEHERIELDMYVFYSDSCEIKKIEDGQLFNVADIDAVSCLPKGNITYSGMKTGEYGTFINRGDGAGASLAVN